MIEGLSCSRQLYEYTCIARIHFSVYEQPSEDTIATYVPWLCLGDYYYVIPSGCFSIETSHVLCAYLHMYISFLYCKLTSDILYSGIVAQDPNI